MLTYSALVEEEGRRVGMETRTVESVGELPERMEGGGKMVGGEGEGEEEWSETETEPGRSAKGDEEGYESLRRTL